MIKRCGVDVAELLETLGHVTRVGEDCSCFRNQRAVGMFDRVAYLRTVRVVDEIAECVVPKLISGSVLVQNPEHLVRVRYQVSREAQADEPVDTRARNL